MQDMAAQQFQLMSKGKTTIQINDVQQFAKKIDQAISQ